MITWDHTYISMMTFFRYDLYDINPTYLVRSSVKGKMK